MFQFTFILYYLKYNTINFFSSIFKCRVKTFLRHKYSVRRTEMFKVQKKKKNIQSEEQHTHKHVCEI